MENNEKKIVTKKTTGMIKRANPLTLSGETRAEATPAKKVSKKVASTTNSPVPTQPRVDVTSLSINGPRQLVLLLPLLNKQIVQALKAQFPKASLQQLTEQGLLLLIQQQNPEVFAALVASLKNKA